MSDFNPNVVIYKMEREDYMNSPLSIILKIPNGR